MTNNDIFRRIRYIFDFGDQEMIELFQLAEYDVDRARLSNWLKKEDELEAEGIPDKELATFLNGLIIQKRGKREGPTPIAEDPLSNNMILRKLKIALELRTEDMLDLFAQANKKISKHELSAFFRNPSHKSYRLCMDQYLRSFLNSLQAQHKPDSRATSSEKN